jgi:cytochrome bd ubiquinol oxidase subunit II
MIDVIVFVLAVAILLYVILGGADFGAGIVEIFTDKKSIDVISRAIAPVWEANHVWVILSVVILFNGFPVVYSIITTFLHIPLLIVLLGIILRGSAFTFRYYDAIRDKSQDYYTLLFKVSSVLTPFFYGVTLGAIILGRVPAEANGSFYNLYIYPWVNGFTFVTGIFLVLLFGWIASVYLIGEAHEETNFKLFLKLSRTFFILLIISGLGVFIVAEFYNLHFFLRFVHSPVSIVCVIAATIMVPLMWRSIHRRNVTWTRFLAGAQTACILTGWFAIQFPIMLYLNNGSHLTVWNSKAPDRTLFLLMMALIVGVIIIFPAVGYLLKVFKFGGERNNKPYIPKD